MLLIFAGCGQKNIQDNQSWDDSSLSPKTSTSDCLMWCQIMRKANEGNKDKSVVDMNKDCNSLCSASAGMENNDLDACEKSQWILKDTCFSEIAQEKNDTTVCKKIGDQTILYSCYTSIAQKQKDLSICENIHDKMRNSICIDGVKTQ